MIMWMLDVSLVDFLPFGQKITTYGLYSLLAGEGLYGISVDSDQ